MRLLCSLSHAACLQGGGEGGDAEGLEKMLAAMGGAEGMGGLGGMPGMGMGAGRTPEDHKKEVEALKAVSRSLCPRLLKHPPPQTGLDTVSQSCG